MTRLEVALRRANEAIGPLAELERRAVQGERWAMATLEFLLGCAAELRANREKQT